MSATTNTASPSEFANRVFTVPEAAAWLTISKGFLYVLISEGKIRPVKLGSRTIITGAEIARFLSDASDPPPKRKRKRAA